MQPELPPIHQKAGFQPVFGHSPEKMTLGPVRGRWRAGPAEPANTRGGGSGDGDDGQGTRSSGGCFTFSASDNSGLRPRPYLSGFSLFPCANAFPWP